MQDVGLTARATAFGAFLGRLATIPAPLVGYAQLAGWLGFVAVEGTLSLVVVEKDFFGEGGGFVSRLRMRHHGTMVGGASSATRVSSIAVSCRYVFPSTAATVCRSGPSSSCASINPLRPINRTKQLAKKR